MRIAVIQFPTSVDEPEIMLAVERAGMEPVQLLWSESVEKLDDFSGFILAGGFSHAQSVCARVVAIIDPLIQALKKQSELAKPILGISQGAQILVEAGLVPGIEGDKVGMALTKNKQVQDGKIIEAGFYNAWVHVRLADEYQHNAFTRFLTQKDILSMPVAHAEGRFMLGSGILRETQIQGQQIFQYCDEQGQVVDSFPVNPNGSINNIAAVSNKTGNVMAIMFHPERTMSGNVIFDSMRDYIQHGFLQKVDPLYYLPRPYKIKSYQLNDNAQQYLIRSLHAENQANAVESTFRQLGVAVKIKCYEHWEVESVDSYPAIITSDILFNLQQDSLIPASDVHFPGAVTYLVRAKEDLVSPQKIALLAETGISAVQTIKYGLVWQISSDIPMIANISLTQLASTILFNPYAEDCYEYEAL